MEQKVLCAYFLEAGGVQLGLVNDLHSYLQRRQKAPDSLSEQVEPRTQLSLLLCISASFCLLPLSTSIQPDGIST